MADYTVISSASRAIINLLEKRMVPQVLRNSESIALCSPDEKGNMQLYVYLYHIGECREILPDYSNYRLGTDLRMENSRYLYLYYMFTASSSSEVRFRAFEEQSILGKVIQILGDHHSLDIPDFSGEDLPPDRGIPVTMMNLTQEEIGRIWSGLQTKQHLALYYRVGPVEMESEAITEIVRVRDAEFGVERGKR